MSFRKAGTRTHTIDFEVLDKKEQEALMACIKERGRLTVRLLEPGQVFDGKTLTESYEQIID